MLFVSVIAVLPEREKAPVAQLDRVADFESVGRRFESFRAHHKFDHLKIYGPLAQLVAATDS